MEMQPVFILLITITSYLNFHPSDKVLPFHSFTILSNQKLFISDCKRFFNLANGIRIIPD